MLIAPHGCLPSFPDRLLPDMAFEENATGSHLTYTLSVAVKWFTLFEERRGPAAATGENAAIIAKKGT